MRIAALDPEFDASRRAFYYVRVLEIPTPRWTAYDAKYFGIKMPPEVPMRDRNALTPRLSRTHQLSNRGLGFAGGLSAAGLPAAQIPLALGFFKRWRRGRPLFFRRGRRAPYRCYLPMDDQASDLLLAPAVLRHWRRRSLLAQRNLRHFEIAVDEGNLEATLMNFHDRAFDFLPTNYHLLLAFLYLVAAPYK